MVNKQRLNEALNAYTGQPDSLNNFATIAEQELGENWTSTIYDILTDLDTNQKEKLDHVYYYYGATLAWGEIQDYLAQKEPLNIEELNERIPTLEYWLTFFGDEGKKLVNELKEEMQRQNQTPAGSNSTPSVTNADNSDITMDLPDIPDDITLADESEIFETTENTESETPLAKEDDISEEPVVEQPREEDIFEEPVIEEPREEDIFEEPIDVENITIPEMPTNISSPVPEISNTSPDDNITLGVPEISETVSTQPETITNAVEMTEQITVLPQIPDTNSLQSNNESVQQPIADTSYNSASQQYAATSNATNNQQYDENGYPIDNQQYDENSYPIDNQQYDENGYPIDNQQYDENSYPIDNQQYDENGYPIDNQQYDENGYPIDNQQYDENGYPINNQQYDENGYPLDNQQYDENGYPIDNQQYDENGYPINYQQYDENGYPIDNQQYDENGYANAPYSYSAETPQSSILGINNPLAQANMPKNERIKPAEKFQPEKPETNEQFLARKAFKQLDFINIVHSWMDARCISLGNIEIYNYKHYGFLIDAMEQAKKDIQEVLASPAYYPAIEAARPNGLQTLQNSLVALEKDLEVAYDNAPSERTALIKDEIDTDEARRMLGMIDTTNRKEYLGPAPDGFEMIDDPFDDANKV